MALPAWLYQHGFTSMALLAWLYQHGFTALPARLYGFTGTGFMALPARLYGYPGHGSRAMDQSPLRGPEALRSIDSRFAPGSWGPFGGAL